MEVINACRDNLASVLMGKCIQFHWRGQKDVVIIIPYREWLVFIQEYGGYLQRRSPMDYNKILNHKNEEISYRYFFYEVSWALYSELACSSNVNKDSTLILPYFDNGKNISFDDALNICDKLTMEEVTKFHKNLCQTTRYYYSQIGYNDIDFGVVDLSHLSLWNVKIFKLCLFLQSRSSNTIQTEKLNIDWRSL